VESDGDGKSEEMKGDLKEKEGSNEGLREQIMKLTNVSSTTSHYIL
jgi:hypothetical protein